MSLLVSSSSSRIAQGFIKAFYATGKYENIVCADLYPNYWSIQRHCNFMDTLTEIESKTKITDLKITGKSDLTKAISKASDLLYVTHDYYENVSTKENLLKQTSLIAAQQKHLRRFITVLPTELDNWIEQHPIDVATKSAETAHQAYNKQVILRTDLLYGNNSILFRTLLSRLANHQSLCFKPSQNNPQPLCSDDLIQIVQNLLDGNTEGVKYLAQGQEKVSWQQILAETERLAYAKQSEGTWERIINPINSNNISEMLYERNYINIAQMINKYHQPPHIEYESIQDLGVKLTKFDEFVQNYKLDTDTLKIRKGSLERVIMNKLY